MLPSTEFPYENLNSLIPDMPTQISVVQPALEVTLKTILCEKPFPFKSGPPAGLYGQSLPFVYIQVLPLKMQLHHVELACRKNGMDTD
jgi:hypothetical protein